MATLFGTLPDGREVYSFTLRNKNGMTVSAINYGGIITSICVPDKSGKIEDVVLGYDSLDGYLTDTFYMGAIIGRCANRIAHGNFLLDGKQYNLVKNDGDNSFHGGKKGFNTKWWNIQERTIREGQALRLTYTSLDGEEGYPGKLGVEVYYILTDKNELIFRYKASANKRTVVDLTNHTYFNLSAGNDTTIENHLLQIKTNYYLPVDGHRIPLGDFANVSETPFDFRESKSLKEALNNSFEQVAIASGIDHSFVVPTSKDSIVRYEDLQNGRVLEIITGEPGVHIYTGNILNVVGKGKNKIEYQKYAGIAFATQHFPDSIHHSNFPSVVLNQGREYTSETRFMFSVANN